MGDVDFDENTFLCGYQRIRRYGSTSDLNSPIGGCRKYTQVIQHEVQPSDTLQSLQLKYNSSMFEIKRLNKLWSNDSLYCRTHVSIPLYNESPNSTSARLSPIEKLLEKTHVKQMSVDEGQMLKEGKEESVKDFFKRIDQNVRRTKKVVRKMNKVLE